MPSTVADRGWVLLVLACLAGLSGCANPPAGEPGYAAHDAGDLIVIAKRDRGQAILYRVQRNGRIHFGGGKSAMVGDYGWAGEMSEADFAELNATLESNDWFAENPDSAGTPKSHYYRVTVYRPSGNMRRFTVHGPSPALDAVLDVCNRSSRQRLEPFMQTLPKPGVQQ